MSLTQFLEYAAGPGVNAIVGFILSFAADSVPGYSGLNPKWKRGLMMAACFCVPIAATLALGRFDQEAVWGALTAGFVAFFGSQAAHARAL